MVIIPPSILLVLLPAKRFTTQRYSKAFGIPKKKLRKRYSVLGQLWTKSGKSAWQIRVIALIVMV